MHILKFIIAFCLLLSGPVLADESADLYNQPGFKTTEQILSEYRNQNPTECASNIFSNALISHSNEISEEDEENKVRVWARSVMAEGDVLEQVLQCPEIQSADEADTIVFTPIIYRFENGRTITINYSTQPKVLKQKLILSRKRSLPNGDVNPMLMDPNDPAKYLNTEPAWYAIMVVQHGSLEEFVGPGKNNTLSAKYIEDNIDKVYPHGYWCTSRSAWANDKDTINQVVKKVVDIEGDTNDYYVAGDIDLGWIMYAEIAADVILTVATMGGGQFISGTLKGLRATKTGIRLAKNMNKLKKFVNVGKFTRASDQIDNIKNYQKLLKEFEKAQKAGKDVSKYEKELKDAFELIKRNEKELQELLESDVIKEVLKDPNKVADILNKVPNLYNITPDDLVKNPDLVSDILKQRNLKIDDLVDTSKEWEKIGGKLNITESALKNPDMVADILKSLQKTVDRTTDVSKELKQKKKLLKQARKNADPLSVKDYDKKLRELDALRDSQQSGTTISRIKDPTKRAKAMEKFNEQQRQIEELEKTLKDFENTSSLGDYPKLRQEVDNLESVEKYIDQSKQLDNILKYHSKLTAIRRPQTGNIVTRNLKKIIPSIRSIRAAGDGARMLGKAERVARAGMSSRSAKFSQWLFDATLKHGSRLARLESKLGKFYGAVTVVKILGDMYDHTSTTSNEFSNGIDLKPFCLLSADDLEGQDNVVNYGMWLMWVGNSTDSADDDAAYLQSMDFAAKFFYQLDEFQDENGANCNVDIYVVRPIIRLDETNETDPSGELFYLFMNEIPWSTAEQFGEAVPDIEDWDRAQQKLNEEDPNNKYHTHDEEKTDNEEFDDYDDDDDDEID